MNQYPGVPPQGPSYPPHPSRRQDYPYAASPHPPQYIQYYAPASPHPGPVPYGPPPHYIPQWYPYQQYPYPPQPQPQQPPRHYSQHHQSPLIVSSTTHQPVLPINRQYPPPPTHAHQQPPPVAQLPLAAQSAASSTTSQNVASPSTTPITTSDTTATPPIVPSKARPQVVPAAESPQQKPLDLQLPWFSVPESSFPTRSPRRRRRRRTPTALSDTPILPAFPGQRTTSTEPPNKQSGPSKSQEIASQPLVNGEEPTLQKTSPTQRPLDAQTPSSASEAAASSETASTTTSSTPQQQRNRAPTRPIVPALPNIPRRPVANSAGTPSQVPRSQQASVDGIQQPPKSSEGQHEVDSQTGAVNSNETPALPAAKAPPKSWAELLRTKNAANAATSAASPVANGLNGGPATTSTSDSLSDALRSYDVQNGEKISFLEPRGLVNTGNMCYMNSILQVLAFCVPFFELLDQIRKRAVHSFKSNTPLLEAMIMFMNEYSIIDSASSVEQLRLRLKDNELEKYGEAFIPEYVYEAIKNLPRFSSMRRGQQQDAEEFLGLLLEVLHLECLSVVDKAASTEASTGSQMNGNVAKSSTMNGGGTADGWMEVQRHQKPAVTQTSGAGASSPVTKIFGGALRSEFRVSGNKNSVTMTPYQQLQLDINDPVVTNITHALKNLARSERVDGEFATSRGTASYGTKQFFIETLPPVLILHLKRFHYDSVLGSTQKIWKRVGYPLDLEIPKESFAPSKRAQYSAQPQGFPSYRLTAAVYHHGKHASGGHYTVDVRRQEGREWIRLDDTVIRRVRPEDVANEGGEEDPKILAAALERHKREEQNRANKNGNPYVLNGDVDGEGLPDGDGSEGWSQVNANGVASPPGTSNGGKKWSGVVTNGASGAASAGTATPKGTKTPKDVKGGKGLPSAAKDKVAYILFYERV